MRIGKNEITLPFYPATLVFAPKKSHHAPVKLALTSRTIFVWTVANDSTAHRTTVTAGETTGNRIAIIDGIAGGDRIVTEGYQKLSEGTKVVF